MPNEISLRDIAEADLPILFEQQLDPEANRMAAFTAKDPADRVAFDAHWQRIRQSPDVRIRTIVFNGEVAGSVLSYVDSGHTEVSYWLGRDHWGKGIATHALKLFIAETGTRPLFARAAKDNVASLRVLDKCGFRITGEGKGFANARGMETEEHILTLT
jgi:RimJ/RimL family protein N-acetyltransferase